MNKVLSIPTAISIILIQDKNNYVHIRNMFFVALIRGKGILDGWIGIKAHFYFAQSISRAYWEAIWS